MILNPWDSEAYSVHTTDGVMSTLWVPNGGGGFLILVKRSNDDIPEEDRTVDGKQPSGII